MQSATWLRIAAGLAAFETVGHTIGAVLAGPSSPEEAALRDAMGAFRVSLMGIERSYWDFYLGSGWAITALAGMAATIMWLLVPIARESSRRARPISGLYFVTAPIVIAGLITTCLVLAAITNPKSPIPNP